jgi:hypothetical protein
MTPTDMVKDLIVLVGDKYARLALEGLFSRPRSLGVRAVTFDLLVHPEHDAGCALRCERLLKPAIPGYLHALVIFDLHGTGRESLGRVALEAEAEQRWGESGWENRAAALAIVPELETWVWSDSPHVESALGWVGRQPSLRKWLVETGLAGELSGKPAKPKEAVERALKIARKPKSAGVYKKLAETVGLTRCTDPAFIKLREVLKRWFGA